MWKIEEEEIINNYWVLLGKVNDDVDRIILSCSIKDTCKINTFVKKEFIKLMKRY